MLVAIIGPASQSFVDATGRAEEGRGNVGNVCSSSFSLFKKAKVLQHSSKSGPGSEDYGLSKDRLLFQVGYILLHHTSCELIQPNAGCSNPTTSQLCGAGHTFLKGRVE